MGQPCLNEEHKQPCNEEAYCGVCGISTCSPNYAYHVCARKEPGELSTDSEIGFCAAFNALSKQVNDNACLKGWYKGDRNEGELIALIHSELSEALEALRHGNPPDDKIPEFSGVEAELADVVIRIMDMAAAKGYRVGEAIEAKIIFNRTRPYKHGGKRF